jgi:hypothetical protein
MIQYVLELLATLHHEPFSKLYQLVFPLGAPKNVVKRTIVDRFETSSGRIRERICKRFLMRKHNVLDIIAILAAAID